MRKVLALLLTSSILMPMAFLAGCGSDSTREPTYVQADSPWFDYDRTIYGQDFYENATDGADEIARYSHLLICPEQIVLEENVMIDQSGMGLGGMIIRSNYVSYDSDGELIGRIECDDEAYLQNCFRIGDNICASFSDIRTGKPYLCTMDFENGQITDRHEAIIGSRFDLSNMYKVVEHDGLLYMECAYLDGNFYKTVMVITDYDGNVIMETEFDGDFIIWGVGDDGNFYCLGLDRTSDAFEFKPSVIDGQTGEIRALSSDRVKIEFVGNYFVEGTCVYGHEERTQSIIKYDIATGEESTVFEFDWSYANSYDLMNSFDPVYCDDDNVMFVRNGGYIGIDDMYHGREIIHLTRADSNPNAGKQILTIAAIDWIDQIEGYGISKFNSTNPDYYAVIDKEYDPTLLYWGDDSQFDTIAEAKTYLTDKLRIAVEDGTGPDIILNAIDLPQFMSEELVVDLIPYMDGDNGINRDEYFSNCFDVMMRDDKLYGVPFTADVNGMFANPDYVPSDITGVTYSEYRDYCNEYGYPDIFWDMEEEFKKLMRESAGYFYTEDGHLDIDNEAFRELVATVDARAEGRNSEDCFHPVNIADFSWFLWGQNQMYLKYLDWSFIGEPSAVGYGPMLCSHSGASITRCCSSTDGAWAFIKCVLTKEVQCATMNIPLNIAAFDEIGPKFVEVANERILIERGKENYYDYGILDLIKDCIAKVDCCFYENTVANTILGEEMPAYYTNQKTLDDVIVIVMDRVNNMIDEKNW